MKHYPILLLLIFTSTGLVTDWCSKLLGSTKTLIDKTKNGENVLSLEVVEVVLVQCNYRQSISTKV